MGFWQNLIGIEEDDEDEELEEIEETKEKKPFSFGSKKEDTEEKPAPSFERKPITAPAKAASKSASPVSTSKKYTEQVKLIVIKPVSFEESPKLVDNLKAKKPVIINLEDLETDVARKIFDFLSGATYALNGNVQKVANNIFLFAPENVDVTYSAGTKPAAEEAVKSPWN